MINYLILQLEMKKENEEMQNVDQKNVRINILEKK